MRDRIAALLYVVILTVGTLVYADKENVQRLKHPLDALAALWIQATNSDAD
jgi:hypothetical protein